MSDENYEAGERTQSGLFIALVGFAVLASAAGLIWSYTLETRLQKSQTALTTAQQQNDKLAESLNETNAKLKVTTETLGQSVGLTQRQLEARANEFLKRQAAETARQPPPTPNRRFPLSRPTFPPSRPMWVGSKRT
jgi:F0F1-type ATP synthase membrane subunit b/b'